jgi:hypothetical protein
MDNLDQDLGGLPILKKSDAQTSDLGDLPILKKKVGTSESLPLELPSQSQVDNFSLKTKAPDKNYYGGSKYSLDEAKKAINEGLIFDKSGKLYAPSSQVLSKEISKAKDADLEQATIKKDLVEQSREMPVEQPKQEGSYGDYGSNIGANILGQTFIKAADIDIAAVKFLRNLSGKLPFTEKPQDIYDEKGQLTNYGKDIQSWDFMGKAIKSFKETQEKDKELLATKYKLPETTGGQIVEGLTGIIPDLAMATMTRGKNLFSGTGKLASLGNALTGAFPRQQLVMGTARGYNASDNKGAGGTFLNTLKEGVISAGQAALFELAGITGTNVGKFIGSPLKNITAKEAINLGSRLAVFTFGVPTIEKGISEGRLPNQSEILQNLGIAGAMEAFHLGMSGAGKVAKKLTPTDEAKAIKQINDVRNVAALDNFMKATPDVIDNLVKSDKSAEDLNLAALDAIKRAEDMADGEEKSKVLKTAQDLTYLANIKKITELIANSPDALSHFADDLPVEVRDSFMQKAKDIHVAFNPAEQQKQSHVDTIAQAENAIKQNEALASPTNPNVKERLDAQREIEKAKATIDQATKDFNKTSDEQEQQKQALQDVKLAQQQTNDINDFANRIASGEKMQSPEDLQFYDNNKKAIEETLASKAKQELPTEEGKPTEEKQPIKEEVKEIIEPIRQLGTGANVYFENNKYRVNDNSKGKVLLNIEGKEDGGMAIANIEFDSPKEAVDVAKELSKIYPDGIPDAVLIDKVVDDIRNRIKVQEFKPTEVKAEVKPTEVKGEVKTYNAKDLKENPNAIKSDENYITSGYPNSFVKLFTNMRGLKNEGFENAKIGDVINIFNKDYVVEGFIEKKNIDDTKVKLIRVDENGNLLREQDLSKREQKEGKAKEFEEFEEEEIEEEEVKPEKVKAEVTQDDLKKAEAKFAAAKDKFEKAKAKVEASQVTQRGMFGGEQKGMFAMGGEEAKNTLDPLRIATKEAKAELDDIRNRIKVQEEAQQELKPVEKTEEKQKPFKSSQGHSVELENGKLIVKDKKGEVLSDRASKKAIEEYADNFDYSKGEKAPEIPNEITNSRDAAKYVIDESNNPEEIAQVYASEDLVPKESNPKFQAIAEHGLGRIKTSSYKNLGDPNKIEKSMYLKIFSQEKGLPIDVVAKSISDKYEGLNIEPKDIVDYIEKYSRGDKGALEYEDTDVALQAKDKFNKLTGLDLTPELANKVLDKQLEKANQEQLDIIKEDYETAKQLEDAYWAEYEKTDGFTKESPVSKVNEPKTAPKEKVTISEESIVEEPEGTTSIKNKTTAEERANKGLSEIEVEAKRSFPEVFEKGKKLVDEGKVDARKMAQDLVEKPRPLSPEESVALLYDRMKIQNEYKKLAADIENEPDGIVKDLMVSKLNQLEQDALVNDEAARKTGYEQGLGLAVRKMIIREDYSLLNQLNKYKAANKGEELTPEIRKKLEENVSKLEEAQKKLEEYEQKIKDLQAKKTIETESKKTKKVNKTAEDFKKEREDIFKNIKDKWDSASKSNIVTAVPVPYASQLAAISPEVLKLVKSYAEQGITKLDDIVNDLHNNISKSIPEITKRDVKDILAGEYTKEREKKVPSVDREKMKLEANVKRIKNQIDLEKQEIIRGQRSRLRKGVDYFQAWRRAALLSGVPVLGKIGLSGGIRATITTPIESLIGKGLSMIPGLSKVAAKSPRESAFDAKKEAKAFAQLVDKATYQDVRQVLKTGRGELEELHDKRLYPSNGWLDFFGNLHAAIKVIPKRAEYFRALEYRTEYALKNGVDISDPVVQQELSAGAYADALRSIYMQENYVTELYKNSIKFLENAKGGTGKPVAEALKFILPIIKVPTNYVAEQSSYILGGVKALYALRKGISKLTPEEADYVMRALRKQSIGAAFLMLGYANPQAVGGYYTGKRRKDDLAAGDLVIFGVHMPHWALHTPLLEALQFGASIRRARDKAGKSYRQKDLNMFTGIVPAGAAVLKQVPFAQQAEQLTRIKNADAFYKYVGGQAQSVIDPQLIKNIAEFTDYSNGQWNKREAKTFEEKLKAGFPGTRQQLKVKKQ